MLVATVVAASVIARGQTADSADDPATSPPAQRTVTSRIHAVDLFKNGMAVVHRTVELRGSAVHTVEDVPSPIHGTFSIVSERPVVVRASTRVVDVPVGREAVNDLATDLAGRSVTIHFRDGVPPVSGRVVDAQPDAADDRAPTRAQPNRDRRDSRFIVLATGTGHIYADQAMIAHVTVNDGNGTVRRERPVLTFQTEQDDDETTLVNISYLTHGITWAPEYRIDLSDSTSLTLTQSALIRNELADLDDVEVRLITGFPAVEFGHVRSLLAEDATLRAFLAELSQVAARRGMHVIGAQRLVMTNAAQMRPEAFDATAIVPTGEGADVHYQPIGKRDINAGETLGLTIATGKAEYDRIVEWIVPDTRDVWGRWINDENHDPGEDTWDAVRFANPLDFPMTTAPVTMVAAGRFFGQQVSYWVSPGETTTLRINRALSVRTRATEQELAAPERQMVALGGASYRSVPVEGEVTATNQRNETIELVVRRRFSGDLVEAEGDPRKSLREEGSHAVNPRNELVWTIELAPGATWTAKYRYDVLVRH